MALASRPCILIVEDEPGLVSLYEKVLAKRALDYESFGAADPALERLLTGAGRFQAVLLDLNLPDGTGLPLVARFRCADPDVPLVLISGSPLEFMTPANAVFLQKPFQISSLTGALLALGL
jgi:DNA-binding NtrC family response regulator